MNVLRLAGALSLLGWLYWLGSRREHYLLFHCLSETFSIVVGFSIFTIAWNARRQVDCAFLSTLGMALLPTSLMDLLHTLAYRDMNIFPGIVGQSNLAAQLWVAGRLLQVSGLLAAAILAGRKPRPAVTLGVFGGAFAILAGSIFWWGIFPRAYDDARQQLTAFKTIGEYVFIALMGLSLVLVAGRGKLDRRVAWFVAASILAMMLAEAAFTRYRDVYGPANRLGHLLKIVSFYFIYLALVHTGLRWPYNVMFRHLKLSQHRLQQAHLDLEQRVQERTADLKRTVEQLEREVRDRIEAQKALRQGERKFRNLVEHLPAITYVAALDSQRSLLYVSPQIEHLLGYAPEDFESDPALFARILHSEDRMQVLDRAQQALQSGGPLTCEYRLLGRDGGEYWVRDESRVIYDEASQPLFVQGFIVDITARKKQQQELALAEQQAQAQRLRFFSVLNMLPGYVALRARDGSIRFANNRYVEWFGPLEGRKCYQLQYRRDEPCADCPMDRVARTGRPEDWEWTSRAGRTFHVWAYPMTDTDGTEAVLEMGVDVTEQKNLERQVIEASESERRNIGRTLHDTLGQNLTGLAFLIKGLSQKLSQRSPQELAAANQIVELVNEAVSQVRSIARGLDPLGLEQEGLTSGLQELARSTAEVFGIACDFQAQGPVGNVSLEVASHLYYIAQEAVSNAVKHARARRVSLRLQTGDSRVKLSVSDDGIGLPAGGPGGGMGMHIMRYRARAVGGFLAVRSGPQGGTVVTCSAPIR